MAYPPAEVNITKPLVQALVSKHVPQFADLPITYLDEGWDNVSYRLGKEYIIRLPRRAKAIPLLQHEIRFLPLIENQLPIPIPSPIFVGNPDREYPWQWTITPFFQGHAVDDKSLSLSEASRLAIFLKKLHNITIDNLPKNEHRDVPLSLKENALIAYFERLENKGISIPQSIHDKWNTAVKAPPSSTVHLIHGDLHPSNIIMQHGEIEAVIDWGDITKGDPATDLGSLWLMFPYTTAEKAARENYGADTAMIQRSIGWAIYFVAVLLDTGTDSNHVFSRVGNLALERMMED